MIYFNNYDFLKKASRILFIEIVNTLKNTNLIIAMVQNIIDVKNLSKSFNISSKEPGLKGTIKHFFRRKTKKFLNIKKIYKYLK